MPLSSPFAFCVYIAARYLLVFWRGRAGPGLVEERTLAPEFRTLLQILYDMARRWAGPHGLDSGSRANLAGKYAQQLNALHARCVGDEHYRVDPLGYTTEMDHIGSGPGIFNGSADESSDEGPEGLETAQEATGTGHVQVSDQIQQQQYPEHPQMHQQLNMARPTTTPLEYPPIQGPFPQQNIPHAMNNPAGPGLVPYPASDSPESSRAYPREHQHQGDSGTGEVAMISQILMDRQFLGLDRVISYDDGMFNSEFDNGTW
ncbi:hypothetical protein IMZ48_33550 [Candidatus Bathyarchaeota archaeon]|nr:hypothetical protein [Candidatus Bathyarchaeota archaeon]